MLDNKADEGALEAVQQLARNLDEQLKAEFGAAVVLQGGNLLLGEHYARSARIFLGLNPGGDGGPNPFIVDREPANFWDRPVEYRYWRNCHRFVNGVRGLHGWMTPATAAFCCPWRTRNGNELYRLNNQTNGRVFEYAGRLVRRLIEDHRKLAGGSRLTVIVAGRASLCLLFSPYFLHCNLNDCQAYHNGCVGTYQWAKAECDGIVTYQVPHFSRANSAPRLRECAQWLATELALTARTDEAMEDCL